MRLLLRLRRQPIRMAAAVRPTIRPIHMPCGPMPSPRPSPAPSGMPRPQYENMAMNIGTRVSFSPRSAPAESTWMPSGNWNAAAYSSSVEASAFVDQYLRKGVESGLEQKAVGSSTDAIGGYATAANDRNVGSSIDVALTPQIVAHLDGSWRKTGDARAGGYVYAPGIRSDLPVLIASGDADPLAGGGALIQLLGQRYRDAGLADVTVKLYPGARHEILNESNRDEVTADIVAWLRAHAG